MSHRGGPLTLLRRWLPGAPAAGGSGCVDPTGCCGTTVGPCARFTAVWDAHASEDYLHADPQTRCDVDAVVRQLVLRPESVRSTWSATRRCWTAPLLTGRGVGQLDYTFEPAADHVVVTRLAV